MEGHNGLKRANSRDLEASTNQNGDQEGSIEKNPIRFKLKSISRPGSKRGSAKSGSDSLISNRNMENRSSKLNFEDQEQANEQFKMLIREKKRLEKINDDLSKKLMHAMKDQEQARKAALEKQKKMNEHQVAYLTNEINELKDSKERNVKALLNKIHSLQKKLDERETQMNLLGSGIESLNQELKMREDPSQNAIEVVTYLEKFAKYQNDFMMREIRSFQDDYNKLKDETYGKMSESEEIREVNRELAKKLDKQNEEIDMYKEMIGMKKEEATLFEKERKNYTLALENIRKDGYKLSTLKKENNDLVSSKH